MTEQDTLMTALQVFATHIPARVRHMPDYVWRIDLFLAEAVILVWNLKRRFISDHAVMQDLLVYCRSHLRRQIIRPTFRATPFDSLLLLGDVFALIVVVAGNIILLLHALHGCAVTGPTLQAIQVKETVAIIA